MTHNEYAFGSFATDIAAVAQKFNLNLNDLEVEFFTPARQAIVVETVGKKRFKVHINLEENRIIAVKQVSAAPVENGETDQFAKYKSFMK